MLRIQAPVKQTATDTISTLSSRLQSATLLEDRRAAILGLRSFAKLYPASVASGALRDLISSLRKDGDDLDTIKVVLETLLMLFAPDPHSAEASEEIALWLADEFTQRQDNITVLLDLLESRDFYPRLYSLQLISHISTARPERTQECIFTAPLGVSRLVAVLDDRREAVRNEALILLIALTPSSTELQKVVAFENAFDRIFALIAAEGSLTHGSMTVQDCLSLLANLLRLNVSNQSYFREIGCVSKLAKLLAEVSKEEDSADGVSEWAKPQRDMNVWGLLAIVQLFLTRGGQGTHLNQMAFWQSGLLAQVLQLAFRTEYSIGIRAKSLSTCADLIRDNAVLQEQFGDLAVPRAVEPPPKGVNGRATQNGGEVMNVIEALLKLSLEPAPIALFDARLTACQCLLAFFSGHQGIRSHVLRRAIEGHKSGEDEIPNILTVLIQPHELRSTVDTYQIWMASVLLFHLLFEFAEAKALVLAVSDGDAENGEEVITCVQSVTGNLLTGIQRGEEERGLIGYLMLLCGWLFEDPDSVNDFLGEGSNIQSLIQATKLRSHATPLVTGLCAALLGIVYEFSSKDSPIPRSTLHDLLITSLSRESYIEKLTKLRENPFVRDFEVLPQGSRTDSERGLPEVFFDKTFLDFLKDNFSRLVRSIDRDPGLEVSVMANGVQKGISRELVDSLRTQVEDRTRSVQDLESAILTLKRRIEEEELGHRRTRESSAAELARIKNINDSLQRHHEEELRRVQMEMTSSRNDLLRQHQEQLRESDQQFKRHVAENEVQAEKLREINAAEIADLKKTIQQLDAQVQKSEKDHIKDLQTAHEEYSSKFSTLETRASRAEAKAEEAEGRAQKSAAKLDGEQKIVQELNSQLEAKETARKDAQTELDDLLIVFADLEGKRSQDKKRLKALGEEVSEGDDDSEDGDEREEDEDD